MARPVSDAEPVRRDTNFKNAYTINNSIQIEREFTSNDS